MSKTIGLFGATGSYDFGDYAMLVHNIQLLHAIDPDFRFVVFTLSVDATKINLLENLQDTNLMSRIKIVDDNIRSHVRILSRFWRFQHFYMDMLYRKIHGGGGVAKTELLDALSSIDIALFNGGGYLQHSWEDHNIKFMIEILLAKRLGKHVIFLANSVGPMFQYDKYTRETLPLIDSIMVRDGKLYTWKLLESYGISQMVTGADDLFFASDMYTEEYNSHQEENYIIIEVMAWIERARKGIDFAIKSLSEFIDYIIENEHKNIVLINFDLNDSSAKYAITKLVRESKHNRNITAHKEIHNMYEVFSLYRNCSYSLSFKYHPVILALGNSKPCAGVITDNDGYYESKLKGAFETCELDSSKHVFHIDDLTGERLIETYKQTKNIICSAQVRSNLLAGRKSYINKIMSYLD